MGKSVKILFSIPPTMAFLYWITFWFPKEFIWLIPDMKSYYIITSAINGLNIICIIFLVRRLWSFNDVNKATKWNWTWLIILFSWITIYLYVWKKDKELKLENNTMPNNV